MNFLLPNFSPPDFSQDFFINAPNVKVETVKKDGVAPKDFSVTSAYPEYYKINGRWVLPMYSAIECTPVVKNNTVEIKEFRNLKTGDQVVLGHFKDGTEGIYKHIKGFDNLPQVKPGRYVESSFSRDYEDLYSLLEYEKNNDGYIVWVLGPAVAFDHDARDALSALAKNGYVHSLLAGNALATHDLEGGLLGTSLGQNIYTQKSAPKGHYNHLDLINEARRAGSIKALLDEGNIKDGFIKTCSRENIPMILAGSIRDDGPLPTVIQNASFALDAMQKEIKSATVVICLATLLHSVAASNLASSYKIVDKKIRPVYFYAVDIAEYAVNQVAVAREHVGVKTIVTNVQDFVFNLKNNLLK